MICPDCGNRCSSERSTWTRKNETELRAKNAYRCQACALNHPDKTPFGIRETKMDEALIEYMSNFTIMASKTEEINQDTQLLDIKNELKQIENQREKYQRAWANDLITDDEFKNRMDESRLRYESLQKELINIEGTPQDPVDIERFKEITKSFNENYFRLNQEERRAFVQTFIESIKIEIIERTKGKGYRNQKIRIADVSFY